MIVVEIDCVKNKRELESLPQSCCRGPGIGHDFTLIDADQFAFVHKDAAANDGCVDSAAGDAEEDVAIHVERG